MTDPLEQLAMRLRQQPDRPLSVHELAEDLDHGGETITRGIDVLARRDGFFDLGKGRMMFSEDADRVAFEIFRTEAPNITFEEFHRYRDEPHILMRMSRDRDISGRMNPEKQLREIMKDKEKSRGNRIF
jgi:hypothetical protein